FTPFRDEGRDGYDTVEWAAAQPWCSGRVGVYGPSYLGVTTLLAARGRPPSLRCAVPIGTADDSFNDWVYRGGAFNLEFAAGWARGIAALNAERLDAALRQQFVQDLRRGQAGPFACPLAQSPGPSVPGAAPWWSDWLAHDRRDDYWLEMSPARDYTEYNVPMLHIGGWWDLFVAGAPRDHHGERAPRQNAPPPSTARA